MQATIATAPYRIHRYPTQWIESWELRNGRRATLRPVLPQDDEPTRAFVGALSATARRNRFHGALNGLSEARAQEMTQIDYQRHMGFVITVTEGDDEIVIADGRYVLGVRRVRRRRRRRVAGPGPGQAADRRAVQVRASGRRALAVRRRAGRQPRHARAGRALRLQRARIGRGRRDGARRAQRRGRPAGAPLGERIDVRRVRSHAGRVARAEDGGAVALSSCATRGADRAPAPRARSPARRCDRNGPTRACRPAPAAG